MAPQRNPVPRKHHFVPQCWLLGFTEKRQKADQLWVTDLKRKKQWASSPPQAGHRRDFYRVADPQIDPIAYEKAFSDIEDVLAPLLKQLDEQRRYPTDDELEILL